MDKRWHIYTQIEQRMHFDGRFGLPAMCPRKAGEAKIDCRRIECIDAIVEFEAEIFVSIEQPTALDQGLSEISVNTPVAFFVGIGQRADGDFGSNANMVTTHRFQ